MNYNTKDDAFAILTKRLSVLANSAKRDLQMVGFHMEGLRSAISSISDISEQLTNYIIDSSIASAIPLGGGEDYTSCRK